MTLQTLSTLYHPLTSRPFLSGPGYTEYSPCDILKPYIACFWGSSGPGISQTEQEVLVIPDTCVDVIIEMNHTTQKVTGRLCGIQDYPILVKQESGTDEVSSFAVRFYFWAVHLFLDLNLREIRNQSLYLEQVQPEWCSVFEPVLCLQSVYERISWMERFLIKQLRKDKQCSYLFNSISRILESSGRASVKEVCNYSCVSQRQLERLFSQEIGISIKRTARLVRYQNVWRDIVSQECFEIQDAVNRYGYTDQSHLLNEFKQYHGVSIGQAKRIAVNSR